MYSICFKEELGTKLNIHVVPSKRAGCVTKAGCGAYEIVPGHSHLQSLIACSMQMWRGKTWEI